MYKFLFCPWSLDIRPCPLFSPCALALVLSSVLGDLDSKL